MCDFPENLQIKREPSSPSTPENKSPNNIKAKLNLHVKRRLQDFNQLTEDSDFNHNSNKPQVPIDIKQEHIKAETTRQKRPYHKRTDKNKTVATCLEASTVINQSNATTPQRKYKHRTKQIALHDQSEALSNPYGIEESADGNNANITSGAISAGDEDEGGHDGELKAGREKEKCPDVLAMLLSMKKRTLMQDPEVQNFLKDVMEIIKS